MSSITVRIDKGNSPNLGFRLQGGKDFGTPLVIQKVNGGSPAERAGLVAGDAVIKINNTDVFNLRHKDAQDVVVRAGNSFELVVQRGGSTWKPSVIPTGPLHSPAANFNNVSPVTRTSLAAKHTESIGSIGTGHNLAAKPFSPQLNGAVNGGSKLVNKQYNTPVKLYSEESIAETLSAQTEVLSTGALGVNFKKNERNYDSSNSEVLRALKEAESEPNYNDQEPDSGVVTAPNSGIAGLRHVQAPENRPQPANPQLPPGQNICADCERLIVGVFVRIKDKNLHVECFKCSTCGTSLKNVGYYNIQNKLYCDIHAKAAALKQQSNPNLVPVTVPPGGRAPAHSISSALSSHSYPSPPQLSPKLNTSGSQYQTSNFSGPKPFSSVNAPLSPHNTLPRAAPLSPVAPAAAPSWNNSYTPSAYSPSSVQVAENIIWPPPQDQTEVPTACPLFYPPPSQIEQLIINKRKEKEEREEADSCSEVEEINEMARYIPHTSLDSYSRRRSTEEVKESLTETLGTQILVDNIVKRSTPQLPVIDQDIPVANEHLPARVIEEEPARVIEEEPARVIRKEPARLTERGPYCPMSSPEDVCCRRKNSCELRRPSEFSPVEDLVPTRDLPFPLKWESPLTQAVRTTSPDRDTFACIPTKHSSTPLASALSVAPSEPFTPAGLHEEPVPLPEETEPYFPPERPVIPEKIDAPIPPTRKKFGPADKMLEDLPKPEGKLSMLTALTTASDRPYSPFIESSSGDEKDTGSGGEKKRLNLNGPVQHDVLPLSFGLHKKDPKPPSYYPPSVLYEKTEEAKSEQHTEETTSSQTTTIQRQTIQNPEQIVVEDNQNLQSNIAPLFHGFSCSFQNKGDITNFSVDVSTTPPVLSPPPSAPKIIESKPGYIQTETITEAKEEKQHTSKKHEEKKTVKKETEKVVLKSPAKQAEEVITVKPAPPVALHKPTQLPQYQVELSAEAETELLLFERKRQAEMRLEQQKHQSQVHSAQENIKAPPPAIKVETEDNRSFKPVMEDRPPRHSFSPRPGSSTPSRSGGKPPSILPYYQANLVPQHMPATLSTIFDPKSPAVSRSPSPHPGFARELNASPLPKTGSNIRPLSPAGPPENPLKSTKPLPTPETIKIDQARESLTTFIPEYKSRRDVIEDAPQMYTSLVQTQTFPACMSKGDTFAMQRADYMEAQQSEKSVSQEGCQVVSMSREEQMKQAHLEQMKQSKSESTERSADGMTQIQRKRTVTEEYERSQKEVNIQIEKNVTSTKKYPFTGVNAPALEVTNVRGHLTDPQRLSSSFLRSGCSQIEDCLRQRAQSKPQLSDSSASASSSPSSFAPHRHVNPSGTSKRPNVSSVSQPDAGAASGRQSSGVRVAPKRGRGILNPAAIGGARIPLCGSCNAQVRGPFITALGKIWCPNHFICATQSCRRPLQDIGFVEERGQLYCEYCFEQYLAPPCSKCSGKIKGDCLKAIGKNFHPECFNCTYCGKLFGNSPFFLEDGSPYCEADWNELFTTKCFACAFPIEAGDRWVEALNNNYHSQCFNCTMCKKNLEGQSFFAKGGRPFCKNHAR